MAARVFAGFWFDRGRPQRTIADVLQCNRQGLGRSIDRHVTEKLQAETRRKVVPLLTARGALKDDARAEGAIKHARSPCPGMERTGNEFPEWLEVLKHGIGGVEIVCGGVVQVGGNPYGVANA